MNWLADAFIQRGDNKKRMKNRTLRTVYLRNLKYKILFTYHIQERKTPMPSYKRPWLNLRGLTIWAESSHESCVF